MANRVKIAVLSPTPKYLNGRAVDNAAVDEMISHWEAEAANVVPDKPDIIVIPECSDRYGDLKQMGPAKTADYYTIRGERVADFWRKTASENNCYIAYSAYRQVPEGHFRNSTVIIDRGGKTAGVYDKNYPTTGEIESMVLPGKDAPLIECDFGRVACAICFDLNFNELLSRYASMKPDLILFSSMYHGGLMQNYWAYSCRAHFAGAIAGGGCHGSIISPVGSLIARSTNYYNFIVDTINLDSGVFHIDFNGNKFLDIKKKYGRDVLISDPGFLGAVLISCESEEFDIKHVRDEFSLEPLDDYFARCAGARNAHMR